MLKKIMFSLLTLIMLYSTAAVVYRIFEPRDNKETVPADFYLDYESLKEYLVSTGEGSIHYLFFSSRSNADCQYVMYSVMPTVNQDENIQIGKLIEPVDITKLEKDMATNRLMDEWGIATYPAFAAVHIENSTVIIDNTLQYDPGKPMKANEIEAWLKLNGLIH